MWHRNPLNQLDDVALLASSWQPFYEAMWAADRPRPSAAIVAFTAVVAAAAVDVLQLVLKTLVEIW